MRKATRTRRIRMRARSRFKENKCNYTDVGRDVNESEELGTFYRGKHDIALVESFFISRLAMLSNYFNCDDGVKSANQDEQPCYFDTRQIASYSANETSKTRAILSINVDSRSSLNHNHCFDREFRFNYQDLTATSRIARESIHGTDKIEKNLIDSCTKVPREIIHHVTKYQITKLRIKCDRRIMTRTLKMMHMCIVASLLLFAILRDHASAQQAIPTVSTGEVASLVGQAGTSVRLPCLIGRQFFCGEPYFIAWYKSNANKPGWTRIEYVKASSRGANPNSEESISNQDQQASATISGNNFLMVNNQDDEPMTSLNNNSTNNRFTFVRGSNWATCDIGGASGISIKRLAELECAQLEISKLELADEGQYKCEITFSESLEMDKCPPSSISRLTVIARPEEPELLVNGRLLAANNDSGTGAFLSINNNFKEGAQVKLECQSSGGKPAPRIEWLNVTRWRSTASNGWSNFDDIDEADVQLIRLQRKTSTNNPSMISSSSALISLSRFDLNSQFVCIVIASQHRAIVESSDRPVQWAKLLRSSSNSRAPSAVNGVEKARADAMFKWLKFNIQVKPITAQLIVRDPLRNVSLSPMSWQPEHVGMQASSVPQASFYSLQLNHLYLLQCIVDKSRPASQVAWFNRTVPIALDPIQMDGSDFELPTNSRKSGHRLTSYVSQVAQADGTFRTVGSLLLTTNIWDNYEEIFCRVSNEAFHFEELTSQVAPILSAGLYVNYAPFARLELEQTNQPGSRMDNSNSEFSTPSSANETIVRVDDGAQLSLRCLLAANPQSQASILQIEWFKDHQKLDTSPMASRDHNFLAFPFAIERANQLHLGASSKQYSSQTDSSQLLASSKLLAISTLILKPMTRASSGVYSCHFKIIPAPGPTSAVSHPNHNQPIQPKIISGRSKQLIQVKVVEAKPKAPTLRIQSSTGFFVYKPALIEQSAGRDDLAAEHPASTDSHGKQSLGSSPTSGAILVGEPASSISLRCDAIGIGLTTSIAAATKQLANGSSPLSSNQLSKISWFANGHHLHSSSTLDAFNVSLATLFRDHSDANWPNAGATSSLKLTCSHQIVLVSAHSADYSFHANQIRQLPSSNEIELRLAVGPELAVKRLDLMPQVRSFSEFELDANPGQKLRLACQARCEPLCSLRWFINSNQSLEPISGILGSGTNTKSSADHTQNKLHSVILRRIEEVGEPQINRTATSELDALGSLPQSHHLKLIKSETISRHAMNGTPNSFWISETTLNSESRQQLLSDPGALMRELADSSKYNVHSSLDLTYNQLRNLLITDNELFIKCGIGSGLNNEWAFKYELVEAGEWYPSSKTDEPSSFRSAARIQTLFARSDLELNKLGELETKIILEKPPRDVRITFNSISGPEVSPFGLSIAESQLIEFSDPEKPRPLLKCLIKSSAYPPPKFKWIFTHLNGTEDQFHIEGSELDFRQTIQWRQRQIQANPSNAYGYDVVTSLSGNYTCIASNIHGSKADSLAVQIHGRPLCKISLDGQHLNADNSLSANLRCNTYSIPALLETVWYRGSREVASNTTGTIESTTNKARSEGPLDGVQLSIPILNKDQDFIQADLTSPEINYKCLAKNSLGYSELCELGSVEKQLILLKNAVPTTKRSQPTSIWPLSGWPLFTTNNNNLQQQHQQLQGQSGSTSAGLTFGGARIDLILAAICCILLIYFGFLSLTSFVRRQRKLSVPRETNWHFSSTERRHYSLNSDGKKSSANNNRHKTGISEAFQSSIGLGGVGANYYGGSNGDSEHDIIQSCSQSSQYEDLIATNQQRATSHNYQSQALYFNHELAASAATMNRRTNGTKLSRGTTLLTPSSRNNAEIGHDSNQLVRLELDHSNPRSSAYRDASRQKFTTHLAPTGLMESEKASKLTGDKQIAGEFLLANTRVPLIDGTQTSRIKLEDERDLVARHHKLHLVNDYKKTADGPNNYATTYCSRTNQSPNNRAEHIYDDVIYKKMVL